MIVLRVVGEGVGNKCELGFGDAEFGDEETAVVPALVVFNELLNYSVGPLQLVFKGKAKCKYCLVAVLPTGKDVRLGDG